MRILSSSVPDISYPSEYVECAGKYAYFSVLPPGQAPSADYPKVRLKPRAVRQLLAFIRWGEQVRENRVEQAGIPYGYVATEKPTVSGTPRRWSVVCGIIAANTPSSTQTQVGIPAEEWMRMQQTLDTLNIQRREKGKREYQSLGWFHTHPNWLDPFFSKLDIELQPSATATDDRFGLVFNPHRLIWAAYAGPESRPEKGVMELDDELLATYPFEPLERCSVSPSNTTPTRLKPRLCSGLLHMFGGPHRNQEPSGAEYDGDALIDTYACGPDLALRVLRDRSSRLKETSYNRVWNLCRGFGGAENAEMIAEIIGKDDGAVIRPLLMYRKGVCKAPFTVPDEADRWRVVCTESGGWQAAARACFARNGQPVSTLILTDSRWAIVVADDRNDEPPAPDRRGGAQRGEDA